MLALPSSTLDRATLQNLSVLVVDDDEFARKLFVRQLTRYGVKNIKQARDGVEALKLIEANREEFDFILSDLDMPNMDGMEFIRMLSEQSRKVALAITSSWNASFLSSVQSMCAAYGVETLGILQKPISADGIEQILKQVLHLRNAPDVSRQGSAPIFTLDEILEGIAADQFEPFFQPKLDLTTGQFTSAEALARWRHPVHGFIAPFAFIDTLEKAGEMDALTFVMIRKSAQACLAWRQAGFNIDVAVNLSLTSLVDIHLGDRIFNAVHDSGLRPEQMTLEITETAAMTETGRALESLARLRMRGFGLSIDDFGTGFASMEHLSRVAFTELKIDRGFVSAMFKTQEARAIVESSIGIANRVGIKSVAEGVETLEELKALRQLGCDIAQGFLISRPLELNQFIALCREERVWK